MNAADIMLAAALEYADMGWKVFPVNGKVPFAGTHGFQDATSDPEKIRQFWAEHPGANVAVATGAGSGLTIVDVDDEGQAASVLEKLPCPPTVTATTGKGRHLYYRYSKGFASSVRPLGDDTGIDIRSDGGYVVAPPSLHASGRRYAWVEGKNPDDMDPEALPEAWIAALEGAAKAKADPGQQRTADGPIPEGVRHKTLVSMAGSMRRAGLDAGAILAAIRFTNETRCSPLLPNAEVERIAADIGAKPTPDTAGAEAEGNSTFESWKTGTESGGLLDVDLADLGQVKLTPPEFAIKTIIPAGTVTLLGGHGGAGKSSLALAWAAHIACGQQWAGLDCRQGMALYVSLEDDGDLVKYRLQEIAKKYGLDMEAIREHLSIVDGSDFDASLSIEDRRTGQWRATPLFKRIEERAVGAAFIVLDNASDAFSGNEIVRREVRLFIRLLGTLARREHAGLVLLAHVDKSAARGMRVGQNYGQNYSGSTAWHNSVRSRLALIDDEKGVIVLKHEKSNLGPKMRQDVKLAFDGPVLVPNGVMPNVDDIFNHGDEKNLLTLMARAIAQGADLNTNRAGSGSFYTCLKPFGLPRGWTSETVYAALDRLLESGQVQIQSFRRNYKDRTRFVLTAENPPNPPNPLNGTTSGMSGQSASAPPNPPNGVGGMGGEREKKESDKVYTQSEALTEPGKYIPEPDEAPDVPAASVKGPPRKEFFKLPPIAGRTASPPGEELDIF